MQHNALGNKFILTEDFDENGWLCSEEQLFSILFDC